MSYSVLLAQLKKIVGARYVVTDSVKLKPFTEELRGRYPSVCIAVVLPGDSQEVSALVQCCAAASVGIVPQGGNTGTVGGTVACADQVIINMARMNQIVSIDLKNNSMHVQAGCVLATIQQAAHAQGRFFPLHLGSYGHCQIGGNLATNAGGNNVLRYGNARDLTLGLEVVVADGRIYHGLNCLRKNNTGYDLKSLFIGSEGTLGIITAAILKLFPAPHHRVVALCGLKDVDSAVDLLAQMRMGSGDRVTTFELMADIAVQTAISHIPAQTNPLRAQHQWYVLIVVDSFHDDMQLQWAEEEFARAWKANLIQDAVIAENEAQADRLLLLRENIVEAQRVEGASIKHDVSVPINKVSEFLRSAKVAVQQILPGARPYPFGHLGDGNIHYNISQPVGMGSDAFFRKQEAVHRAVYEIVQQLGGSFSAEHGIGITKLTEMKRYKDTVELTLYRQIKQAIDPQNLFNRGKLNPISHT